MNMFNEVEGILGYAQTEHLNQALNKFFGQAREIRTRLGGQAYLLDKYLSFLFETVNQRLAHDAASDGFETAGELIGICAGIVRDEPMHTDHWFYTQAREYIESHPLTFQEPHTQVSMYCTLLNDNFMKLAIEQYVTEVKTATRAVLDICDLRELYDQICGLLGSEELMERLNMLFRQRFLIADTMTAFLQGMTNQLLYWLTYRDRETSRQIFQLLPDGDASE
jgi:hypothetical protein